MTQKRFPMESTDASFYDSAPIKFTNSIDIPVNAATVFKILEDDASWSAWAGVIDDVEWTSPKPFGLGTTRTVTMAKGLMVGWEEFIAWEPGKRMGFCFKEASMDGIARFAEDWHVNTNGDNQCSVSWTMCFDPKGVNKFILKLFSPIMTWNFKRYLRSLCRYAIKHQLNPEFKVD